MLTKRTHKGLVQFFKIVNPMCGLPYTFSQSNNKIVPIKNTLRLLIWHFNILWQFLSSIFSFHCFLHGFIHKDRKVSSLSIDILFFTGYGFFSLIQINTIIHKEAILKCLNETLDFDAKCTARFGSRLPPRKWDGCDILIMMFNPSIYFSSMLFLFLFLENVENPRYFYHLLPIPRDEEGDKPMWILVCWIFLEYFELINCCAVFMFYWFFILIYTRSSTYWLRFLWRVALNSDEKTRGGRIEAQGRIQMDTMNAMKMYRQLWMTNVQFNDCTSRLYWPAFQMFNLLTHMGGLVISIKLHNAIHLPAFGMFPLMSWGWTVLEFGTYPVLGQVNDLSSKLISAWKEGLESDVMMRNWGKRAVKAFKPLGIRVGSLYSLKKTTVLIIVGIVINLTVNAVLLM